MNDNGALKRAVLWLQTQAAVGNGSILKLMKAGLAERAQGAAPGVQKELERVVGERTAERIASASVDEAELKKLEKDIERKDIKRILFGDEEYPESLRIIDDPPPVLYTSGDKSLLKNRALAVVGSRTPTKHGERAAYMFSEVLARCSLTIVSGLARGIDAAAHRAALEAGGKTIAVLGTGVDVVYPTENRALYSAIVEKGLVISEYAPGTKAVPYHFPERNRIISGLAEAVLIPEAREKSGALITADYAIKQGKELFIVPSSVYTELARGSNRLLKELQGAMVLSPDDVIEAMGLYRAPDTEASVMELDVDEEKITDRLKRGDAHFEELLALTRLKVSELNALLTGMELKGLIHKAENNYYGVN